MAELVQSLQLIAGVLWLLPALSLSPRIFGSWKRDASRATMLAAPIGFFAWLQVGFTARWLIWPHSLDGMVSAELTAWAALYALSAGLAVWIFQGALQTKGD